MSASRNNTDSWLGAFVLPLARALGKQGQDPIAVMSSVGVDPAKLANPDWRIAHDQMACLLRRCVELSDDEAFGLVAAEQLQPQMLHALGLAWLASDTVYGGLQRLVRFGRMISTGLTTALQEERDIVHLDISQRMEQPDGCFAGVDYTVGMVVQMCRLTLGDFLAPVIIELHRPLPTAPERWEYMLASRVLFDRPATRISWSLADIEEPLLTGDPTLAQVNDDQTQAYLDTYLPSSTCREVVNRIVVKLPDGPPSQRLIADEMHVSNRTLQRKLKEEGTTFKALLQDARFELARKYLKQPGRSIVETAYLLGFSEPSTFSRAFKRWTGLSPQEYRQAQQ